MPRFKVVHIQAVWETVEFECEAPSKEHVEDNLSDYLTGAMDKEQHSQEITGTVESVDSELTVEVVDVGV